MPPRRTTIQMITAIRERIRAPKRASCLFLAMLVLALLQLARAQNNLPRNGNSSGANERLPRASIDGGYFVANGRRFIPVGAHWVAAKAAMQWPTQWDPAEIEADFAKMHELGYNMTRIDILWAWFEPRPGDYNPEAFSPARLPHLAGS